MSFNNKKANIIETFKSFTGLTLEIQGDIKLQLIPTPKLIVNDTIINNEDSRMIEVSKLSLLTSFSSFFSNSISIKKISLENGSINANNLKNFENYFNNYSKNNELKINEISFINFDFIINPEADLLNKISKINGELKFELNDNSKLFFKGSFYLKEILYNLDIDFNVDKNLNNNSSSFKLYNDFLNFSFLGSYQNHNGYNIKGKTILKISHSPKFKNTDYDPLLLKLIQENIELKSDLSLNQGQAILENITLFSNSIDKGLGKLSIIFGCSNEISLDLDFNKISLDAFFNKINASENDSISKFALDKFFKNFLNIFNFDLPDNINGDVRLKIKDIIFNNKKIENIILELSIFEGKFIITNALAKLPGNTDVKLSGGLTHNDIRSKFQGKIDLKINELKEILDWFNLNIGIPENSNFQKLILQSTISILPRNLNMEDIKIAWGNLRMIGKSYIKNNGDKNLTTKVFARIDKIDTNELSLPSAIDEFLFKMYAYDIDKNGTKFIDITQDFKWLRTFPVNFIGEFLIDDAIYKTLNFKNVYTNFRVSNNNLYVDQLDFMTTNADFNGSINLQVSGLDPKIKVNLNFNRLNELFLRELFPDLKKFQEAFIKYNHPVIDKVIQSDSSQDETKITMANEATLVVNTDNNSADLIMPGFNFFSLDNFNGEVNLKVNSYSSDKLSFQNLDLKTSINEGLIGIQNLSADIFNGKIQILGSIVLVTQIPSFNLSFALNNFDPGMLLNSYGGYNNITGYMSMNGKIATSGIDFPSAVSRATGNFKIAGKTITWKGFDIGEVIKLTEIASPLTDKLDRLKFYSLNGSTVFDEVDGNIDILSGYAVLKDCNLSNIRIKGAYVARVDLWNKLINGVGKISFIPYGTTGAILLTIGNTGKFNEQAFQFDSSQLLKFLNQQAKRTEVDPNDEKAQSLLRNRKL